MSLNIYAVKGSRKSKRPFDPDNVIKAVSKIDVLEDGNLIRVSILEDKIQEDDTSLNTPLMYLTIRSREDFTVTGVAGELDCDASVSTANSGCRS